MPGFRDGENIQVGRYDSVGDSQVLIFQRMDVPGGEPDAPLAKDRTVLVAREKNGQAAWSGSETP